MTEVEGFHWLSEAFEINAVSQLTDFCAPLEHKLIFEFLDLVLLPLAENSDFEGVEFPVFGFQFCDPFLLKFVHRQQFLCCAHMFFHQISVHALKAHGTLHLGQ